MSGSAKREMRGARAMGSALFVLVLTPLVASAEEAPESPKQAAGDALKGSQEERLLGIEKRLRDLEQENARMRDELERLRDDNDYVDQQLNRILPLTGRFSGYLDFGFFYVQGNGSGIQSDIGNQHFPEYAGIVPDSWVFYGDPLATVINSRGDPADTELSRAVVFDAVKSNGNASFLVNALNFAIVAGVGDDLNFTSSIDFVPRGRNVSEDNDRSLGDFLDVKLAYLEYAVPIDRFRLNIYAGKFDSVLGFEYRMREAPDRIGVAPSLLCRYTCGSPLGLKARAQFLDDTITLNVAVTNGSHGTEHFPFYDETDSNQFKTIAGRLSSKAPLGAGLEVGVSGSFGAQDQQPENGVHHWHYGIDLNLDWNDFLLTAEFLQGQMEGKTAPESPAPCDLSPCLKYKGAYAQLGYRLFNWLSPYGRADFREALHQNGASFVYISELARITLGARFEFGTHVIVKAEYTHSQELGKTPQFPNDVFTSSMLLKY